VEWWYLTHFAPVAHGAGRRQLGLPDVTGEKIEMRGDGRHRTSCVLGTEGVEGGHGARSAICGRGFSEDAGAVLEHVYALAAMPCGKYPVVAVGPRLPRSRCLHRTVQASRP
jgi:hypothetical protein